MSADPSKPSTSEGIPPNNEHFVDKAANSPEDSTNPAKHADMPKTVEESIAKGGAGGGEKSGKGMFEKVKDMATGKVGESGPDMPDN